MRLALVLLAVVLAGCERSSTVTAPDGRASDYVPVAPHTAAQGAPPALAAAAISPRQEASQLISEAQATRRHVADVTRERAERNVPPLPDRASRAVRDERRRAVVAEQLRLLHAMEDELGRRSREAEMRERRDRQDEYCRDLAHNIYIRSAPLSDVLARGVLGYDSRERRHYDDCMASFARTDRYLAR